MLLSSKSLFHFTGSLEILIKILDEKFDLSYCLEEIKTKNNQVSIAFPMVSFCNIPLGKITIHTKKYGAYGVGLSKEWAVKNNLNSVLYLDENSNLSHNLYNLFHSICVDKRVIDLTKKEKIFLDIFRYLKNYTGDILSRGLQDYKFADEMEWRYVQYDSLSPFFIKKSQFLEKGKDYFNNNLVGEKLNFDINDIEYIFVQTKVDKIVLMNTLNNVLGAKVSYNQLNEVKVKLLSIEELELDF